MADESTPTNNPAAARAGRDSGGFRIRLSDNEMAAARALQEAFGLRSTVAVLGFSLRTLAQQLEQGALAELVAQHRAQGEGRAPRPQGRRDGEARGNRGEDRGGQRGPRLDPFARPSRPAAPTAETPAEPELAAVPEDAAVPEMAAEPLNEAEAPAPDAGEVTQDSADPGSAAETTEA